MKQGIKGKTIHRKKRNMTPDITYKNIPKKGKNLSAQTDFESFVLFTFCFFLQHLVIHPSTSQAATILNPLLCSVLLLCSSPVLC